MGKAVDAVEALFIFDRDCSKAGKTPNDYCLVGTLTFLKYSVQYVAMKHIGTKAIDRELKKGSAELLILSLIEHRVRHGYEIGKLIEERSEGVLKYNVASFYPLLYRLEARGLIEGRWVEKAGQRRRRYYKLTKKGKKMLEAQRSTWANLVNAIRLITEAENA